MTFNGKLELKDINTVLRVRGLGNRGKVQQYIDSEVVRRNDPYVPMDTGALKNSANINTVIGSGEVKYKTPYAKKQYYGNKGTGLRGRLWFERMKADHKQDILRGAAKIAGGRL